MEKKKVLHVVNTNALGGGIGTIIDYLNEGINKSGEFESNTLETGYQRKKVGYDENGPQYIFRPKKSVLKVNDSEGKTIEERKYNHNQLEKILSNQDIIHIHGVPHYGILEHLEKMKKRGEKIPKIINTAHSSVKQEFLSHYKKIEDKIKNDKKNSQSKLEYNSLKYLVDSNILNNPSKFSENYWGSAIWRQEKIMTLADSVQHMNEVYKNQILDEYKAQENAFKHNVIPNGVKVIETSSKRPKKKRILYVGRFAKEKGIDELMDSIPYLLEKHPDAEIKFVGGDKSGKLVEKYKRILAKKIRNYFVGIHPSELEKKLSRIYFTGWISDKDKLQKEYEWTDYVIIPSSAESFSLTASEALMQNRIPIVTATPALKDLYIDKGIALGVEPEKRYGKGIAETLGNILKEDSSKKYDELVKKGNEYVKKNYSFDNMIKKQIENYNKVLKKING